MQSLEKKFLLWHLVFITMFLQLDNTKKSAKVGMFLSQVLNIINVFPFW
jgi:hypothetical protein